MLTLVATPIGNPKDITLRAMEVLSSADCIIGEERREASTLLKKLNIEPKPLYLLNEHSTPSDLEELFQLCAKQNVALISDCGTPSFYDPGFQLVQLCRKKNVPVIAAPGASSLMTLLSLVSQRVTQFYFFGFLPADNLDRQVELKKLHSQNQAFVLMDTPYRLVKLLMELDSLLKERKILIGINLTQSDELVLEGTPANLIQALEKKGIKKAEFILLVYPHSKK